MPFHTEREKLREYEKARELLRRSRLSPDERANEWRSEYKRLYQQNELFHQQGEITPREYVRRKHAIKDGWNQLFPGEDII